jgi:hypothetical protein
MRLVLVEEQDRDDFTRAVNAILSVNDIAGVVNVQRNVYYVGVPRYEEPGAAVPCPPGKALQTSYMAGILLAPLEEDMP